MAPSKSAPAMPEESDDDFLSPGFKFAPTDTDIAVHFLLQRLRGLPLPVDGVVLDDDPYSSAPWDLLARNGKKDEGFFFAPCARRYRVGGRRVRVAGEGTWKGQSSVDGVGKDPVSGGVVKWRKCMLTYYLTGDQRSTGWVMLEYEIVSPIIGGGQDVVFCHVKMSGWNKKRKRSHKDCNAVVEDATIGEYGASAASRLRAMAMPSSSQATSRVVGFNNAGPSRMLKDQELLDALEPYEPMHIVERGRLQ